MRYIKPGYLQLLALLILFTAQACAESNLKMHRIQAGIKDSSGWFFAHSTKGQYSVDLPFKFNDYTVLGKKNDDVQRIETAFQAPSG